MVKPVCLGNEMTKVNYIIASTTESTEVILGYPFLREPRGHLDFGRGDAPLFDRKVSLFTPNQRHKVHIVRVVRTTVLEPGVSMYSLASTSAKSQIGT